MNAEHKSTALTGSMMKTIASARAPKAVITPVWIDTKRISNVETR
jgi:hypothetical protein